MFYHRRIQKLRSGWAEARWVREAPKASRARGLGDGFERILKVLDAILYSKMKGNYVLFI